MCGVVDLAKGSFSNDFTGAEVPAAGAPPPWDSAGALVGCGPRGTPPWAAVRWAGLVAPGDGSLPLLSSGRAPRPRFVVRFAGDPLVAALALTGGALSVEAGATARAVAGYLALSLGLALAIPGAVLARRAWNGRGRGGRGRKPFAGGANPYLSGDV